MFNPFSGGVFGSGAKSKALGFLPMSNNALFQASLGALGSGLRGDNGFQAFQQGLNSAGQQEHMASVNEREERRLQMAEAEAERKAAAQKQYEALLASLGPGGMTGGKSPAAMAAVAGGTGAAPGGPPAIPAGPPPSSALPPPGGPGAPSAATLAATPGISPGAPGGVPGGAPTGPNLSPQVLKALGMMDPQAGARALFDLQTRKAPGAQSTIGKIAADLKAGAITQAQADARISKLSNKDRKRITRDLPQQGGLIQAQESYDEGRTWQNVGDTYNRRDPIKTFDITSPDGSTQTVAIPRSKIQEALQGEGGEASAAAGVPGSVVLASGAPKGESAEGIGRKAIIQQGVRGAKQFNSLITDEDGNIDQDLVMGMAFNLPRTESRRARSAAVRAIRAKLRIESGAVISEEEAAGELDAMLPQVFDSPELQQDKLDNLLAFFQDASQLGQLENVLGGDKPDAAATPSEVPASDLNLIYQGKPVTEEEIEHTMKKHGVSRAEVIQRIQEMQAKGEVNQRPQVP